MSEKKVTLYTWPHCPFCIRAKRLLRDLNISFQDHNIFGQQEEKNRLIEKTGQTTVPYIFFGDLFIGGSDELVALYKQGKIESLLAENEITK
ncbi:MAG: glutaredoxin domain-containing protein [Eubacteriaceae bacterium]|nr:glutaredoxin domain-containing protein [Eubacteriaceae bacterium]